MSRSNGEGDPVLLVPGFSGQDLVYWNVFHRRLERDGFQAFTLTLPGVALQDIRRSARRLAERVREVLDATGAERIHLVGHSLGGLAMRTFVQQMGGDEDVGVAATLGTPHQGTLSALAALLRPAGRQMIPGSSFLTELNAAPLDRPWVNVYAPRDSLVVPYANAFLPGAHNHKVSFGGHWGLLVRGSAYVPIRRALLAHGHPGAEREASGPTGERRGTASGAT